MSSTPRRRLSIEGMIEKNMPPRERLEVLVVRHGETYAALSRMIKRDDGYLQRFVSRGIPRWLRPAESALLARYLRVPANDLES